MWTYPEGHETFHAYSGLGSLIATNWEAGNSGAFRVDEYRADPHQNHYWSYQWDHLEGEAPPYEYTYDFLGLLESRMMLEPKPGTNVFRSYDTQRNVAFGSEVQFTNDAQGVYGEYGRRPVRYYYAPDGKLRAIQRYARSDPSDDGLYQDFDDLISEIRYDALGRRVVQHTRHIPECSDECYDAIERYVWDGDQLLYEMRADGTNGQNLDVESGSGSRYGRAGYIHGPGIDAPLGVMRMKHSLGSYLFVPHADARGQYERGTQIDGSDCGTSASAQSTGRRPRRGPTSTGSIGPSPTGWAASSTTSGTRAGFSTGETATTIPTATSSRRSTRSGSPAG